MNQQPSGSPERQVPEGSSWAICMIVYVKLGSRRIPDPLENMPINIYGTDYYGKRSPKYSKSEAKWAVMSIPNPADPKPDLVTLWESETFIDSSEGLGPDGTPVETPLVRAFIDRLVQMIVNWGWQPYGHGQNWYEYRFRRPNR